MLDLDKKTILVSLRRIDEESQESFDTFFGSVVSFNENFVCVLRPDGTEVPLPYDEDAYVVADPGFYELKDGSTFEDPSFIAEWTVFASEEASIKFQHLNAAGNDG